MKKALSIVLALLLSLSLLLTGCGDLADNPSSNLGAETSSSTTSTQSGTEQNSDGSDSQGQEGNDTTSQTDSETTTTPDLSGGAISLSSIPAYSSSAYTIINNNVPYFKSPELTTKSYEYYSNQDNLDRCGVVHACVGRDIMPTEERGSIGMVKPTGWHTVKYDCIDGKYLYNRCHLIGFQLTGENANTKNLITGTRYMNVDGMLPFENMVADYVKETNNHVMYRVTPMYKGNNLLATGVLMEAYSVEDQGDGVCFNVFVYNVQPGITIDYATGESSYTGEEPGTVIVPPDNNEDTSATYILNKNTKKFHYPDCRSVDQMKESNKEYYTGSRDDLISRGFEACKNCDP